jgi:hypothetical protein
MSAAALPDDWVTALNEALRRCQEGLRRLAAEKARWESVKTLIPQAADRPFALLAELEALRRAETLSPELSDRLYDWARRLAREHLTRYGSLLREALRDTGLRVEGQFPEFRVERILEIRVDAEARRAFVGTRFHWKSWAGDISAPTVAEIARREINRLFGRPFSGQEFITQLHRAYTLALVEETGRLAPAEPVGIFTVHSFMVWLRQPRSLFGGAAVGFESDLPDQFAVDLGRLLAEGPNRTPEGQHLRLHPVRNPREALLVVNFATGTGQNYGLLSFRKETDGGES